jgi:hypothetical protein
VNTTLTETLTRLAQSIESIQPLDTPPAWVEIVGPFDRPEGVRWHADLESLVGFTAPPDCDAIVTIGHGWARSLEGTPFDTGPPECVALLAPGERRRCRVVFLVTRAGELAGYLREGPNILIDEPPRVGRIPDYMRRAFGLATPPPEQPTDGLLAYMWLSNVRSTAEQSPVPLSWPAVMRLHPAIQVAIEGGLVIAPGQLVPALRTAADAWSWTFLAQQATASGWLADLLPAGAGGWMDEGILSRSLLSIFSTVDDLVDKVTPVIAPSAAKKLRTTLGQLGVLPARHAVN